MSASESRSMIQKLKFDPSVEEQLLIPKLMEHNILFHYSTEVTLIRVLALLSLFYLSQVQDRSLSKVLILSRRSIQSEVKESLSKSLDSRFTVLNGTILPQARINDYNRYPMILATPKTVKNDLKDGIIPLEKFSLVVILNAEMGVSSRSLRFIIQKLGNKRVCAFTNISSSEKIQSLSTNLRIKEVVNLDERKSPKRENLLHYSLPLPEEYVFTLDILNQIRMYEIDQLKQHGFSLTKESTIKEIEAIHKSLMKDSGQGKLLIQTGNLLRILHLQKVIITQGIPFAIEFLSNLELRFLNESQVQGQRAIQAFLSDPKIVKLKEYMENFRNLSHPKSEFLLKQLTNFSSRISIVTHNFDNASFLKTFLADNNYSSIQFTEPLSTIPKLELDKKLQHFKTGNTKVCISNTINDLIVDYAEVIIAYDVNAENVDKLNRVKRAIPRIFLLSKQTNEEARFFHLKNLGNGTYLRTREVEKINSVLATTSNDSVDSELPTSQKLIQVDIATPLFERNFPSIFSKKKFQINLDKSIKFPGVRLGTSFYLVLDAESFGELFGFDLSDLFDSLLHQYSVIFCILFPESLINISYKYRLKFFRNTSLKKIPVILLNSFTEVPLFLSDMMKGRDSKSEFD